ncbi:MAG: signal peptidase I [Thiotrichales bacterium]
MRFDLEMALLVGSVLTGLVWLLDAFWLRQRRMQLTPVADGGGMPGEAVETDVREAREPWFVEYSKSFFPVLVIVLLLRAFVAEPFRIPSGSMMPTLLVGDFILVNKFSYGIRLPVSHQRVVDLGLPKRGDVAVFRYPKDPDLDYIKRVIGLPGDRIGYFGKQIFVNGAPVVQVQLGDYSDGGVHAPGQNVRLEEDLMSLRHEILVNPRRPSIEGEYIVPKGHFFVMGDNRDNSNDSRFWGFVPEENLVGKAILIWMNWDFSRNSIDFNRIGRMIH